MVTQDMDIGKVFQQPRGWFFPTREGIDMGPFPDRASAELERTSYRRDLKFFGKNRPLK
ncbi:MAG: hypothetical protein HWE13_14595 [Gammaproteobacteria bacterium]|nr:hypothetical protein [Gammaproteobacteria bacterium]NVK89362.1 hypothetical protein [Gammaproteobacteria bacterium]